MKKYTKITKEHKEEIKRLKDTGMPCGAVAKKLGLPDQKVRYYFSKEEGNTIRFKKNCRSCGQFVGYGFRKPNKQEKELFKTEQAKKILTRAKEMGLI